MRLRAAFYGDGSSSSEEDIRRARQSSDPPVLLTDDSDSNSDYATPNAGKISLTISYVFFYAINVLFLCSHDLATFFLLILANLLIFF